MRRMIAATARRKFLLPRALLVAIVRCPIAGVGNYCLCQVTRVAGRMVGSAVAAVLLLRTKRLQSAFAGIRPSTGRRQLQRSHLPLECLDTVGLLLQRLGKTRASLVLLSDGRLHLLHFQAHPPHLTLELQRVVLLRPASRPTCRGNCTGAAGQCVITPPNRCAAATAGGGGADFHTCTASAGAVRMVARDPCMTALELRDLGLLGFAQLPEVFDLLLAQLQEAGHELELFVLRCHHECCLFVLAAQSLREFVLVLKCAIRLQQVHARLDVSHFGLLVLHSECVLVLLDAQQLLVAERCVPPSAAVRGDHRFRHIEARGGEQPTRGGSGHCGGRGGCRTATTDVELWSEAAGGRQQVSGRPHIKPSGAGR
mmetsp:Transcript_50670/g.147422  ORF Transcript_50670/g.147422 Transcript_50670/m.147422 type:complete len:370 (+) Transcript_50670:1402-2511(+)